MQLEGVLENSDCEDFYTDNENGSISSSSEGSDFCEQRENSSKNTIANGNSGNISEITVQI